MVGEASVAVPALRNTDRSARWGWHKVALTGAGPRGLDAEVYMGIERSAPARPREREGLITWFDVQQQHSEKLAVELSTIFSKTPRLDRTSFLNLSLPRAQVESERGAASPARGGRRPARPD